MCAAIYKNFITDEGSELQRLFHMTFKDCACKIIEMDTMKKADLAAQIEVLLESLYAQTDRYGNPNYSRDDQIGPDIFLMVMGKIKRWETMLYWLFEIDILMEETKLDQIIRDAEKRLEEHNWSPGYMRNRFVEGENGKKVRIMVNAKEEWEQLQEEKKARGLHTDEIMAEAAELMQKYFK